MSLNEALVEITEFGKYSGLKINVDKTQVTWIGASKYNRNILCENWKLKWGNNKFSLLGIEYDVDLHRMITLNFDKK